MMFWDTQLFALRNETPLLYRLNMENTRLRFTEELAGEDNSVRNSKTNSLTYVNMSFV